MFQFFDEKFLYELEKEIIEIRRNIHQNPELSFQEFKTSEYIQKKLTEYGVKYETGYAKTGVVGTIKGEKSGITVGLRADMDALPIQEDNDLPFKSVCADVMHACGHDCHVAMLLGAAKLLNNMKSEIKGTVKLIFQPAEENGGGANKMLEEHLLEDHNIDRFFSLHVTPKFLKVGEVGYCVNQTTAYSDRFSVSIKGKKAHSSQPQLGVDSIFISTQVIQAIYSILSKGVDPLDAVTINIGKINGGSAVNIICDEVIIEGMIRSISADVRESVIKQIESLSKAITVAYGGECIFELFPGYPGVYNDEETVNAVLEGIDSLSLKAIKFPKPIMGAEDFSFFSLKKPSCMVFVGAKGEVFGDVIAHNSKFTVDENSLIIGSKLYVESALRILNL